LGGIEIIEGVVVGGEEWTPVNVGSVLCLVFCLALLSLVLPFPFVLRLPRICRWIVWWEVWV
jgi:hypothetical protein